MPGMPATSRQPRSRRGERLPAVEAVRWIGMGAAMLGPVLLGGALAGLVLVGGSWLDAWSPMGWGVRLGISVGIGLILVASVFSGLQSAGRWTGRFGRIRAAALVERGCMCHDLSAARRPEGWLVAAADLGDTIPGISQPAADRSATHDGVTTMLSIRANERGRAVTGKAIGRATLATTMNIVQRRLIAPAALLALAGLSVALSPAVALAGVERLGHGAWREAAGGEASPSFSRWRIALLVDDADIQAAQRGGPLRINAAVHDAGFGGLVGMLKREHGEQRTARTNFEIRPAPDERSEVRKNERNRTGSPVVIPATHNTEHGERFEASAAGRILSSLNTDRVQVRAASYTPQLPRITPSSRPSSRQRNTPRLGGSTTSSNAGRPGWWRGVSEWRVVDLEPTPALERLWVRITGADGLPRGLYELDPQREGQRVPASAGDVVTIEVDASVRLWGMEVELVDKDAAMPERPVAVDSVFEEVERGASDRVAWRSYRICGHEGSEVGVGVRAVAQRRAANNSGAGGARGLVSDISSPFSLLIAQAADWVETAQSAEADAADEAPAADSTEPTGTGVVVRDRGASDADDNAQAMPTRITEAGPSSDAATGSNGAADEPRAVPSAQPQAGGEPAPAAREASREGLGNQPERGNATNNDSNTPQERSSPGPIARPTGQPQLGGDPEPGTSGQATRRAPEAEPAAEPEPTPPTPPARRIGGGDEPEMVQSIALLRQRGVGGRIAVDPANADRIIIVFGLDAVSAEDRAIALAYRRVLIGEARKAERDDQRDGADERTPTP